MITCMIDCIMSGSNFLNVYLSIIGKTAQVHASTRWPITTRQELSSNSYSLGSKQKSCLQAIGEESSLQQYTKATGDQQRHQVKTKQCAKDVLVAGPAANTHTGPAAVSSQDKTMWKDVNFASPAANPSFTKRESDKATSGHTELGFRLTAAVFAQSV